jgi:hypothetical protein
MGTKIQSGANLNGTLQWNQSMMADSNGPVTARVAYGHGHDVGHGDDQQRRCGIFFLIPAYPPNPAAVTSQAMNRAAVI